MKGRAELWTEGKLICKFYFNDKREKDWAIAVLRHIVRVSAMDINKYEIIILIKK